MKTMRFTIIFGCAVSCLLAGVITASAQVEIWGFVEYGLGGRLGEVESVAPPGAPGVPVPPVWSGGRDLTLDEARVQIAGEAYGENSEAHFVFDILADRLVSDEKIDLREGYMKFNLADSKMELRAGRQPATWGVGDLLFINDLFPKDYVSFFVGRDDAYLKRPVDAMRLGIFADAATLELVYTPRFAADRIPSGERLSFASPSLLPVVEPDAAFDGGELAARVSRSVASWSLAAYGYRGYWKNPQGIARDAFATPVAFVHPRLNTVGASARGTLRGGVGWVEAGWYDSIDDPDGANADLPNSELLAMAGFERSWWSDFTAGAQLFVQHTLQHDEALQAAEEAFGAGAYVRDENRWLMTLRTTQLMYAQTLKVSGFVFWSPTDEDGYLRLSASYDVDDAVSLTLGANLFEGTSRFTAFGMHDENDSVFVRTRMSF